MTVLLFLFRDPFTGVFADPRCADVFYILLLGLSCTSVYSVLRGELWGNKRFIPYCVIDLIEELCMIAAGVLLVTHMTDIFDGAKRVALAVVFSYLVSFTLSAAYFFIKGGRFRDPREQFRPLLASALPVTGMRTSNSLINSAISLLLPARLIAAGFTQEGAMSEIGVANPPTSSNAQVAYSAIVSGEWDVFTGVKLHLTVNDDGTVTVDQEDADLLCDGYEYDTTSGTLVERDPVIVAAGGASVEDSVITGSMNYFVAGVEDAN